MTLAASACYPPAHTIMVWWIWVLAAFLLLIIEFFTTTAHVGFFAVGAFLVAILVSLNVGGPLWFQLIFFATSSVVLLVFVRPIVVRKLGLNRTPVVDWMNGEDAGVHDGRGPDGEGGAERRVQTMRRRRAAREAL